MSKGEKIRFYYGLFLGAYTIAIGVLFIVQAADIYYSGVSEGLAHGMYERADVAARLRILLAPLLIYLVAVIAGFVLSELYPVEKKAFFKPDAIAIRARFEKRLPAVSEEGEALGLIQRNRKLRFGVRLFSGLFCLLAAAMCMAYLFNAAHFAKEDLNGEILAMLVGVMPWVGAAFVVVLGETAFELILSRRELPAVKRLVAAGGEPARSSFFFEKIDGVKERVGKKRSLLLLIARCALGGAAIALLLAGAFNGGAHDVLVKAINICTECIGLG